MRKTTLLAAFGVLALAQLGAPAWMIFHREMVRTHGTEMKFRTQPVDPYDAFRGRYIDLRFDLEWTAWEADWELSEERSYRYVALTEDEDGFARVAGISKEPPDQGPYVRALVWRIGRAPRAVNGEERREARIEWPIDRYYMRSDLAKQGEEAYRDARRDAELPAYATVRVLNGDAVLTGLYAGGKPIRELALERLREAGSKEPQ